MKSLVKDFMNVDNQYQPILSFDDSNGGVLYLQISDSAESGTYCTSQIRHACVTHSSSLHCQNSKIIDNTKDKF